MQQPGNIFCAILVSTFQMLVHKVDCAHVKHVEISLSASEDMQVFHKMPW